MNHHAAPAFWACYRALPASVRGIADKTFGLLKADPRHPSLHFKKVGRFWSARVGLHHRALGVDTRQALRCASFTSPRQVREAIDRFLVAYNAQAVPFEWRKRVVHSVGLKKYYGDLRH